MAVAAAALLVDVHDASLESLRAPEVIATGPNTTWWPDRVVTVEEAVFDPLVSKL
jgi:hypothetical protein